MLWRSLPAKDLPPASQSKCFAMSGKIIKDYTGYLVSVSAILVFLASKNTETAFHCTIQPDKEFVRGGFLEIAQLSSL